MRKILKLIFPILVLGFCGCVLLCSVLLPAAPLRGNETALPAPRLMLGGSLNTGFLTELTDWYAQRFAFRSQAITADSLLMARVFGTSNTDEVIVGKDGWLYYSSTADDFCGIRTLSDRDIGNIAVTLSLLEEAAGEKHMDFVFVIAPNKNTVYPEYMPANYLVCSESGNAEALYGALSRKGVTHTRLHETLSGSSTPLYHKTDSHWNNLGASLACGEILNTLGRTGTDIAALPYTLREDFPGDLAAMLYPALSVSETQQEFPLPAVTAVGAAEDVLYETACSTGTGVLYCWRDSFGNALSPLLGVQYSRAVFSRSVPCDLRLAEEAGADTVIWEIAERNVGNVTLHAPVFEAPLRSVPIPGETTDTPVTAAVTEEDGLLRITGTFDPSKADAGSSVYAVLDGAVYEATPAGGKDGTFTLYLPGDRTPETISLILTENGAPVLTAAAELPE